MTHPMMEGYRFLVLLEVLCEEDELRRDQYDGATSCVVEGVILHRMIARIWVCADEQERSMLAGW